MCVQLPLAFLSMPSSRLLHGAQLLEFLPSGAPPRVDVQALVSDSSVGCFHPLATVDGAAARTACRPSDSLEHGSDYDSPLLGCPFLESPMTLPGPLGLGVLPLPVHSTHAEALLILNLIAATWHRHKLPPTPLPGVPSPGAPAPRPLPGSYLHQSRACCWTLCACVYAAAAWAWLCLRMTLATS